jgi:hypothetical protein
MQATLTLPAAELARFTAGLRALARAVPVGSKQILRAEAGVVLKTWAGRTKVATKPTADRRTWSHILQTLQLSGNDRTGRAATAITVNSGIRGAFGRVWVRTRRDADNPKADRYRLAGTISPTGQSFSPENYRWKAIDWAAITAVVSSVADQSRRKLPKGRASIGLARQSVVQIADDLGISLETVRGGGALSPAAIGKARRAMAVTGRTYRNGHGREAERSARDFFIELVCTFPAGTQIGMDRVLAGVLVGRTRYFEQNVAKGTFTTLARVARAYPNLRITA